VNYNGVSELYAERAMTWRMLVVVGFLLIVGCDFSPTAPSGDPGRIEVVSTLGFRVSAEQAYRINGGMPTPEHGVLADRFWGVLMRDLAGAGYQGTDPADIRGPVAIILHEPHGPDSLMYDRSGTMVGGYYWDGTLHVPGDYTDPDGWLGTRPASQSLLHEMTHHWCSRLFGHYCLSPDAQGSNTVHQWLMPNGGELWDIQWQKTPLVSSHSVHCSLFTE